jgi:C4-dicarboxylate-specific signal transduction histidine kinase
MRTATSGWARRADGSMVPIMSWFSTYVSDDEPHLAAIVVDVSEEVRERDRENYRHLADAQRLMASAVSHEIRNLCSAIAVVSANIERRGHIAQDADWTALTHLTAGLSRIASFELKARSPRPHGPNPSLALPGVLDELRVVIEQDWQDEEAALRIETAQGLPQVEADQHGLLQVFLNLAQNSLRAVSDNPDTRPKALTITAFRKAAHVVVSFVDSGHGVANAENLFQPFQRCARDTREPHGADGTGLGLYVSRTLVRSFGGELTFVPVAQGCRFDVMLPTRESRTTDAPVPD